MAHQQTQTVVETGVFGNNEDWGEDDDYYGQQVMKMAKDWERDVKSQKEGLGKDIKAWRHRQTTLYAKSHPMEQHPVKLAPFPTDRETLRVPLRADRLVVVQSFRDKVYLNIRKFYRHDVTKTEEMVAREERYQPDFGRLERFDGSLLKNQRGSSRVLPGRTRENRMIDESVV